MTVGDKAKAKLIWEYPDSSRLELDLTKVEMRIDKKGRYKGEFCSEFTPKVTLPMTVKTEAKQ
jgi:hypothetical protein